MKTIRLILFILTFVQMAIGQSKRDLIEQINIYKLSVFENKPFDADRVKLFEAMNQVIAPEYHKLIRESESRGICEYYAEGDLYKETLTAEIANDKQPYRVSFSVKKESRIKNFDGTYSEWKSSYNISRNYLIKLQYGIYVALFGPIKLPEDLKQKIDTFNKSEPKQRKQILEGRDY